MTEAKILDLNDKLQRGELTDSPRDRARQMVGYNGNASPHSMLAERSVLSDALDGGGTGLALRGDRGSLAYSIGEVAVPVDIVSRRWRAA